MRFILSTLLAVALAALAPAALAHHGWSWTTGENVEVDGVIAEADLGMPHGVLKLDVGGEVWTIEIGQPWRNERAGIGQGDLAPGIAVRVEGQPSADISERRVKAERLWIGDRSFELYPDRNSREISNHDLTSLPNTLPLPCAVIRGGEHELPYHPHRRRSDGDSFVRQAVQYSLARR